MVKKLDGMDVPPLLDHIGWKLWQASEQWQRQFSDAMVRAGYPLFSEARARLVPHVGRAGVRQSDLGRRMGLSKQAVQQLVDGLVADGVVARQPDPEDARANRVVFTADGLKMLVTANRVKKAIERDYVALLGEEGFHALNAALDQLLRVQAPR